MVEAFRRKTLDEQVEPVRPLYANSPPQPPPQSSRSLRRRSSSSASFRRPRTPSSCSRYQPFILPPLPPQFCAVSSSSGRSSTCWIIVQCEYADDPDAPRETVVFNDGRHRAAVGKVFELNRICYKILDKSTECSGAREVRPTRWYDDCAKCTSKVFKIVPCNIEGQPPGLKTHYAEKIVIGGDEYIAGEGKDLPRAIKVVDQSQPLGGPCYSIEEIKRQDVPEGEEIEEKFGEGSEIDPIGDCDRCNRKFWVLLCGGEAPDVAFLRLKPGVAEPGIGDAIRDDNGDCYIVIEQAVLQPASKMLVVIETIPRNGRSDEELCSACGQNVLISPCPKPKNCEGDGEYGQEVIPARVAGRVLNIGDVVKIRGRCYEVKEKTDREVTLSVSDLEKYLGCADCVNNGLNDVVPFVKRVFVEDGKLIVVSDGIYFKNGVAVALCGENRKSYDCCASSSSGSGSPSCDGYCEWIWDGYQWIYVRRSCPSWCYCEPPPYPGSYQGEWIIWMCY